MSVDALFPKMVYETGILWKIHVYMWSSRINVLWFRMTEDPFLEHDTMSQGMRDLLTWLDDSCRCSISIIGQHSVTIAGEKCPFRRR